MEVKIVNDFRHKYTNTLGLSIIAWVVALFHFISILFWVLARTEILYLPLSRFEIGMLNQSAIPVAVLTAIISSINIVAIFGLVLGSRYARWLFFGTLLLIVVRVVYENIDGALYIIDYEKTYPHALALIVWWNLTAGLRWILWLIFNYWFFVAKVGKAHRRQPQ